MSDKKEFDYQNFPYIYEQYLGGNFEALMRVITEIKTKHLKKAIDSAKDDIFNLATAKGNALDLWGRLLNISRFIPREFDFDGASDYPINDYRTLSDDDFRTIIIWAFQTQNMDITITELIRWLNGYFNMGATIQDKNAVNINDFQDMSERVLYSDRIPDFLRWVLTEYDLIPRPAGVLDSLIPIASKIFGFRVTNDPNFLDYRTNFFFGRFANSSDLPQPSTEYNELAYLSIPTNSGANAPYINTGVKMNANIKLEIEGFMPEGYFGSFATAYADANNRIGQIVYNANNKRVSGFWKINSQGVGLTEHTFSGVDYGAMMNFAQDKNGIKITQNGNVLSWNYNSSATANSTAEIQLFRYNNNTNNQNGGAIKSCKIYDNGVLVRDFIAVKRTADDMLCFYDKVTKAYFENANNTDLNFIEP